MESRRPETWQNWPIHWLELTEARQHDADYWQQDSECRREAIQQNRVSRSTLAQQEQIGNELLDLDAAQRDCSDARREVAVKRQAGKIVSHSRQSLVSRVMPLTTHNMQQLLMQQLLPILTQDRYKDVRWDEVDNRLEIYDGQARDFVAKRVFRAERGIRFRLRCVCLSH